MSTHHGIIAQGSNFVLAKLWGFFAAERKEQKKYRAESTVD